MNFKNIVEQNKELMLKTLKELLQIKSVLDEENKTSEYPFGKGIDDALKYMLDLAKKDGFDTLYDDGYAGHISYGENEKDIVLRYELPKRRKNEFAPVPVGSTGVDPKYQYFDNFDKN